MLDDHNSDIDDIGKVVAMDPSLTSKLLKLANSPLFRFRSQIDNIAKAVNVLGGEALYNLVMAETAKDAFSHFSGDDIDLRRFWMQSIYSGLVGKHLAKLLRVRGSERFFLLGLLHNLAELVITKEDPEKAAQCIDPEGNTPPWVLQKAIWGFTYPECTSAILKNWALPSNLYHPMEAANDEEKALANLEVALLFTSIRVGFSLACEPDKNALDRVNDIVLEKHGMDTSYLEDAIKFSHQEAVKMLSIFSPGLV
jgi:HD-like signal output (HDOD) protein